jgi:hypothetical protein
MLLQGSYSAISTSHYGFISHSLCKVHKKKVLYSGVSLIFSVMYEKHQASHGLLQVEKRIRTDGPQALLKKVDLDHLLDFVHGEKPG